jgi:hypothetical protein
MGDCASNGLIQELPDSRTRTATAPYDFRRFAAAFSILNFWTLYLMHPFGRQKLNSLK